MNTSSESPSAADKGSQETGCCIAKITPHEIMRIVAAAIILIWLGQGVFNLVDAVLCGMGIYDAGVGRAKFLAASGTIQIVFSFAMLRSVSTIAGWVFPERATSAVSEDSAPSQTNQ